MSIMVFSLCLVLLINTPTKAEFILGVGTHTWGQDAQKNLQALKTLGVNSVRDDLQWKITEIHKGDLAIPQKLDAYFDMASKINVNPLAILDYGNILYDNGEKPTTADGLSAFARYAGFSAHHLAASVRLFEVWNEWDLSKEPKTAEAYFNVVKSVSPAIRAANKNALILAGATSSYALRPSLTEKLTMTKSWIERLVGMGVLHYADGISIHHYIFCDKDKRPEALVNFFASVSEGLNRANNGKAVPLYITEFGWPTKTGACQTTPEVAGQYLLRTLLLIRTIPDVRGIWWYDLKDDGTDPAEKEHHFGLIDYNYTPKPAFYAMSDVAQLIIKGKSFTKLPTQEGIVLVRITLDLNNEVFALWTDNDRMAHITTTNLLSKNNTVHIRHLGTNDPAQKITGDTSGFSIDSTPQIITGLKNIQINKVVW